ncbi:MAG TPA: GTP-binding protein [Bryobacteraceae bacterium]|nr:GTP-binding protein [Bryobacteraceae bacterium]
MPDRPTLVLAGGFLGAGKTTLLLRAARLLHERGMRAAIITNDQGGALVDTRMAGAAGIDAAEIAGACFCCRFSGFVAAAESLLSVKPDVIFAEPVGSCADLSATVLQPLKQDYSDRFRTAPYSVLVDPGRVITDPRLAYLFEKQIAEADIVVCTKSDLFERPPGMTGARQVSALTGRGVAAWLDEVLSGRLRAGGRILDIDYSRYAAAEAALGWLNWEAQLDLASPVTPAGVVGPFLERLDAELTRAGASIAHLKIFDQAPTGYIRAGICRNGGHPVIEGDLLAIPALRHELVVNLRARAAPAVLEEAAARAAADLPAAPHILRHEAFQPSPPVPEHRFQAVGRST